MELLVVTLIACVLCVMNAIEAEEVEEMIVLESRLNPNFYKDENAFMEVANALGFGGADSASSSSYRGMRS